ncbi:glycosyltransferase family 2 protein [Desulfopila aestuarii]|uniref:Glycosyltransferase, catalytic subunit of cellulose synthase and poly-beta-1,6-N-acetylglucosamine synthase n=1 Tax=Desulfopila aestuarii DSM 18488 TaxID=1121416 RepID=A0A1M7YFW1_9BACT|nr:Glycosyltransferase, catalytic subunit of cellulose synthase and poly-beta-1,6-N-acetylglucosamine synthase [Desulfopila aestuarii DSM 18488]
MKVSTIIPTYNSAHTLDRAIQSVINQNYYSSEIIIVDDGSTDNTEQVCKKYFDNIKYIKQENSGVAAARNRGIISSSGELIAFLDSDDQWLPDKLSSQINILYKYNKLKWCAGYVVRVNNNLANNLIPSSNTLYRSATSEILNFFKVSLYSDIFQTSAFLIYRTIFTEIGLFNPILKVSEDRDLWWRIARIYPSIGYVNTPCTFYFVDTPNSLTKSNLNRNDSLRVVCDHMMNAKLNRYSYDTYYNKYLNKLLYIYLLRCYNNEIDISHNLLNRAHRLIKLNFSKRLIIIITKFFPRKINSILIRFILFTYSKFK